MKILLNGETLAFEGRTVADLIAQTAPEKPFAVAVNTEFVAKTAYADRELQEGDAVDIVRPVVGG
ncbi:MAG: sulfur carrier protein ThiS [Neisseria sp.]|uniref:sulfur carrier protein ThiS n=1 Tax=Neisseria sp. TaxID=192066 RepID=UPI0026DCA8CA|nr:sulfur carrier protein ThiS [Neisseria sp.]MDO4249778.1 sulfur carrier protein ThiS [Neisseria sp.]